MIICPIFSSSVSERRVLRTQSSSFLASLRSKRRLPPVCVEATGANRIANANRREKDFSVIKTLFIRIQVGNVYKNCWGESMNQEAQNTMISLNILLPQ